LFCKARTSPCDNETWAAWIKFREFFTWTLDPSCVNITAVGAVLNRTITSRGVLEVTGAVVTVEPGAARVGALGDPGMSGAILGTVVEPGVGPGVGPGVETVVEPAKATVAPTIRNSSNDLFI